MKLKELSAQLSSIHIMWRRTSRTHPGCRNWAPHSQRRSRCGVPGVTWCWRCGHSWMPADKCSRRTERRAEARWRRPATPPASAPPLLVSIGSTCQETRVKMMSNHEILHFCSASFCLIYCDDVNIGSNDLHKKCEQCLQLTRSERR